jgi:hypothetical protein
MSSMNYFDSVQLRGDFFIGKAVIYIYVCGKCHTQFMRCTVEEQTRNFSNFPVRGIFKIQGR